jgi:hypothetical protein
MRRSFDLDFPRRAGVLIAIAGILTAIAVAIPMQDSPAGLVARLSFGREFQSI